MKKLILGVTVLVAALAVACGGDDDAGGSSTATATAARSEAASTATAPAPTAKQFSSGHFAVPVTMTADSNWTAGYDVANWYALQTSGGITAPAGLVEVILPTEVYAQDGLSTEPLPADFAAFIRTSPFLAVQKESNVTVGGLSGVQFDVGANSGTADFNLFKAASDDYEVVYNDRIRFIVLAQAAGPVVLAAHATTPARFDQFIQAAEPVIESLQFTQ